MTEGTLLERDEEFDAIGAALEAARGGLTAVVLLLGEAGLGKSALLARARASAGDFEMRQARGEAIDVVLPFGYLSQIFSRAGDPDLLAGCTTSMSAAERRSTVWETFRRFLDRTGRKQLLLLLDDLQWADTDSLMLLGLALRHIPKGPLVVIGALRPWPPAAEETLGVLRETRALRRVRLAPLSPAGASQLLATLTGSAPDSHTTDWLAAWCGGNPLLVHQVARSVGSASPDSAHPDITTGGLPGKPGSEDARSALLLARFTGLDTTGLDFARAAAVCGVQFPVAVAGAIAGVSDARLASVLTGLCRSGVVSEGERPGLASFTHALLRQALYEDLPAPVRAHLHASAFRLLWEQGAPAAEAAIHALAAGLAGADDAIAAVERAGLDALASGALDGAARWLEAAVMLAGKRAEPALRLRLAEGIHACGDPATALKISETVLAERPVKQGCSARAERLVGRVQFELGDTGAATAALRAAAADALAEGDREGAARVLLEASLLGLYAAGPRHALSLAADARHLLGPDAAGELAAWVVGTHGFARALMADPAGIQDVVAGLALVPSGSGLRGLNGSVAWGPRLLALQTAKLHEDFDTAIAAFDAAMAEARREHVSLALSVYSVAHADTLARMGRLAQARDLLNQASEDTPWLVSRLPWAWVGLAYVSLELDRPDQARSYCARVEAALGGEGDSVPALRLWLGRVRAGLALQDADADSACTLMDRSRKTAERSGTYHPCSIPWQHVAIASYLRAGRLDDARAVLDRLDATLPRVPCRWPRVVAARGRAMLAERSGHPDDAEDHYRQALDWHVGLAMPLEHAETLLDYGTFLRRRGSPRRARQILAEAVRVAASTGAQRLERLATEALHTAGGRRRSPATRSTGLTPTQLEIASLAAGGLTNSQIANQLFLSARTVEHHLTHVYETLGIASRRDLRRRLQETSSGQPDDKSPLPGEP